MRKKKFNILLVIRWPVGGIRTFCKYVYHNFNPNEYQFTLLAPDNNETKQILKDLNEFDIDHLKITNNGSELKYISNIKFPLKSINKNRINLIHSHGLTAGSIMAFPAFLFRIPHILTIHETIPFENMYGLGAFLKKLVLSLSLPLVNIIHHVSFDAKANVLNFLPVLKLFKNKNFVIKNGIDTKYFLNANPNNLQLEINLPKNSFLVGFMGRFMPEKGFRYLIESVEILTKSYVLTKKPIVMVFGWGAYIREYKELIRSKKIESHFRFLDFTPHVASALKSLDVLVIPSLREACPLLPMEALTAGVPVIGTSCIGLREILKNTPAKMVQPKNAVELAKALHNEICCPTKKVSKEFCNIAAKRFEVYKKSKELQMLIKKLQS